MQFPKLANETSQVIEVKCYNISLLLSVTQHKCVLLKIRLSSAPFSCRYCIRDWGCFLSDLIFFVSLHAKGFESDTEQSVSYQRNWKLKRSLMLGWGGGSVVPFYRGAGAKDVDTDFSSIILFCWVDLKNNNSLHLRQCIVICPPITKFTVWLLILMRSQLCSIREQMFLV